VATIAVPRQLALVLPHGESFAREDFLDDSSNHQAAALIDQWPDWPARAALLVGPEGSGKSHLAAIWAERSGARLLAGRALNTAALPVAMATGALVVEDVAADAIDEPALFHLLNMVKEQDGFVLITARSAPAGWSLRLPDLASRLRALPIVTLAAPDDPLLRAVMAKLFADRQMAADPALLDYLLNRIERSFSAARRAVDQLDRESLRQKRPVTRALAAELLRLEET